jgi:hypothetical protein
VVLLFWHDFEVCWGRLVGEEGSIGGRVGERRKIVAMMVVMGVEPRGVVRRAKAGAAMGDSGENGTRLLVSDWW